MLFRDVCKASKSTYILRTFAGYDVRGTSWVISLYTYTSSDDYDDHFVARSRETDRNRREMTSFVRTGTNKSRRNGARFTLLYLPTYQCHGIRFISLGVYSFIYFFCPSSSDRPDGWRQRRRRRQGRGSMSLRTHTWRRRQTCFFNYRTHAYLVRYVTFLLSRTYIMIICVPTTTAFIRTYTCIRIRPNAIIYGNFRSYHRMACMFLAQ